ncbi:hypothetical protein B4168_1878 [Anoxybacillus flavithermus]|nr:hypothetical protein B4168_1878 [Anoxybacillus flavithermus]OAO85533.1 hypothetical protein GT23_2436 [Parageobacillus thermoglucosidasius]
MRRSFLFWHFIMKNICKIFVYLDIINKCTYLHIDERK